MHGFSNGITDRSLIWIPEGVNAPFGTSEMVSHWLYKMWVKNKNTQGSSRRISARSLLSGVTGNFPASQMASFCKSRKGNQRRTPPQNHIKCHRSFLNIWICSIFAKVSDVDQLSSRLPPDTLLVKRTSHVHRAFGISTIYMEGFISCLMCDNVWCLLS